MRVKLILIRLPQLSCMMTNIFLSLMQPSGTKEHKIMIGMSSSGAGAPHNRSLPTRFSYLGRG